MLPGKIRPPSPNLLAFPHTLPKVCEKFGLGSIDKCVNLVVFFANFLGSAGIHLRVWDLNDGIQWCYGTVTSESYSARPERFMAFARFLARSSSASIT